MIGVARVAVLDMRTVAPYRVQGMLLFGFVLLIDFKNPIVLIPALVLLVSAQIAAHPFSIADKAGLETLYAVLPVSRRSVLYGHYVWAIASFLATATVGTTLSLLLAWAEHVPFTGQTIVTVVTASWALFAVNVAIQFPLLIRFGYSRTSYLATIVPLALIMLAVVKLHLTVESIQQWLPLIGVAGVAAIVASAVAAVAITADRRRDIVRAA